MRITKKGAITGAVAATLMGGLLSAGVASASGSYPTPNDNDWGCEQGYVCIGSHTHYKEVLYPELGAMLEIHNHYGNGTVCNESGGEVVLTSGYDFRYRLRIGSHDCVWPVNLTPYNYVYIGG